MSEVGTRTEINAINQRQTAPKAFENQDMFGLCCCCRELPCCKDLWSEFVWMRCIEVYGNMIQECFNIAWPQSEDCKYQICEVCITQLRNALLFRRRIEQSHTALVDAALNIKEKSAESNLETFDHDTGHKEEMITETFIVGDNPHIDPLQDVNGACNDTQDQDAAYKDPLTVKSESAVADDGGFDDTIPHSPPVRQWRREQTNRVIELTEQKETLNNHKKEKEKKAKRSRRCQIPLPSNIRKSDVTAAKPRNKDRHKEFRSNSAVENRYNDVPDLRKVAAEQTNPILLRNDEAMTSPRMTCLSVNPNQNINTLSTPQDSQAIASSAELRCLNSDFFEQVRKEAAKQANAYLCQHNVSLTSPKLTRLCLVRKQSYRTHSTSQGSSEMPSSSYLKSLEIELLEQIRKIAVEQTKSIICQNTEPMTSPRVSQSSVTPTVHNSVHVPQEPDDVNSPSYVKRIENELFEQIRKIAAEQTKAMIIRNVEAVTSPRYTRSCFKPCIDSSMLVGQDNPQLECHTDDSYDINANENN